MGDQRVDSVLPCDVPEATEEKPQALTATTAQQVSRTCAANDERRQPTDHEQATLRRVPGKIPWSAYSLCVVEFAERASYFGVKTIFNNFLQFPLPKGGNGAGAPPVHTEQTAGALDKGLQFTTALILLFKFMTFAMPIFGAWLGDAKLGRYNAVVLGVTICGLSHVIMAAGASPAVLQSGKALAPFLVSFFLLAIGTGIFKPCILPIVLEQYTDKKPYVIRRDSGEDVIVDPETTIQRMTLVFFCLTNVGAFFSVATTYCEKHVGFWLAFLLPGIIYFTLPIILVATYKRTTRSKPQGSELARIMLIIIAAVRRNRGRIWKIQTEDFWNTVKSSNIQAVNAGALLWNDSLVEDIRQTIIVCVMFSFWPLWHLANAGIGTIAISQGSAMTTKGAPNDFLVNIDPFTVIIFTVFLTYVLYPTLSRWHINFGRISRITLGFLFAVLSGLAGTIIQWQVYRTSPCGDYATACGKGTGVSPLRIWIQSPIYALAAISECFTTVGGYEFAYNRAPSSMKALVMSVLLFSNALSAAMGQILTPVIKDPLLIWAWAGPTAALACQTIIYYWAYHWMNDDDCKSEYQERAMPERLADSTRQA